MSLTGVHRAIVAVDVEGFSSRTDLHQAATRRNLYESLEQGFTEAGIPWQDCDTSQDRGDGVLILVPPTIAHVNLVDQLPHRLAAALRRNNAIYAAEAQIRLRVAVHVGKIDFDERGIAGHTVNFVCRMLDAPVLKAVLAASRGVFSLMVSDWFYRQVVQPDPAVRPDTYREVFVGVKEENATQAWIRVPDDLLLTTSEPGQAMADVDVEIRRYTPLPDSAGPNTLHDGEELREYWDFGPEELAPAADYPALPPAGVRPRLLDRLQPLVRTVVGRVVPARTRVDWHSPRELPHDVPRFSGRNAELERLEGLVDAVNVAVIDGPAGVGKTALAVHWAHRMADYFPDGQLYLNLRGFDPHQRPMSQADALRKLLGALGVNAQRIPADLDEQTRLFKSVVAGQRVLIVLDNARSAEQVRRLLPGHATCFVVVTSRNRLEGLIAWDGAVRVNLDVLTPPDAIALVTEIIGDARVAAEPDACAELTKLCGYMPLALRIVAERCAAHETVQLADLVGELSAEHDKMLDQLSNGDESTRTVFSWSYNALHPDAARLFRLLGLHPGPEVSVAAAGALADMASAQARQLLNTLASAHMLEEAGRDRYRLHDLLQMYAAECAMDLESEQDRDEAVRRVLNWYLYSADAAARVLAPQRRRAALPRLTSGQEPASFETYHEALTWFKAERANLVAATRQAEQAGEYAVAWKLPAALLGFFNLRKHWADWISVHKIALQATRKLGDPYAEAWTLNSLGIAYYDLRWFTKAAEYFQRALQIRREVGDRYGEGSTLDNLGNTLRKLRRFDESIECYQRALALFREISDRYGEGSTLRNLGGAYRGLRRLDEAVDHYRQALQIWRELRERYGEGNTLSNLGDIHRTLGRSEQAIECYERALQICREIENGYGEGAVLDNLGDVYEDLDRHEDAIRYYNQALRISQEIGDHFAEGNTLDNLGCANYRAGDFESASQFLRQALVLRQQINDRRGEAITRHHLGVVCYATGEAVEAHDMWRQALEIFDELTEPHTIQIRVGFDIDEETDSPFET
ncbi:tetratricopeptide repeat protein [Kibdelosporangium persicum]|uniref:Transcriptional regulator RedD n=1 Tax=Kibdelosporangium persicum TaxID=2698649 RepID=A0ABX2FDW1_9PSEU|nr:tetratricopeptide repeat protein [Kibdelosporangium persicum]NRN69564.1 Transcriptional regulator RedD [Kibdelosporangium persicum]